ncbi:hypothetical protein G6F24_015424 [Rhizopus arrhizus]|nr:hypothetical protein G6F24_015424 [Rhizopus arrhizus]
MRSASWLHAPCSTHWPGADPDDRAGAGVAGAGTRPLAGRGGRGTAQHRRTARLRPRAGVRHRHQSGYGAGTGSDPAAGRDGHAAAGSAAERPDHHQVQWFDLRGAVVHQRRRQHGQLRCRQLHGSAHR